MNNLIKILPAASIAMVLFSFLNMHLYFKNFGIQIQNYVNPSEIIFSLSTFIPGIFMFVFVALFAFPRISKGDDEHKKDGPSKIYHYFKSHKWKSLRPLSAIFQEMFIMSMVLIIVLSLFTYLISEVVTSGDLLSSSGQLDLYFIILIIISSTSITILVCAKKNIDLDSPRASLFGLGVLFIISFGCLAIRNNLSAELVLTGHPKYSASFKANQTVYSTNDSLVYIGATQNFYFLYSLPDSSSVIIASNDVDEIRLRRLRTGL